MTPSILYREHTWTGALNIDISAYFLNEPGFPRITQAVTVVHSWTSNLCVAVVYTAVSIVAETISRLPFSHFYVVWCYPCLLLSSGHVIRSYLYISFAMLLCRCHCTLDWPKRAWPSWEHMSTPVGPVYISHANANSVYIFPWIV